MKSSNTLYLVLPRISKTQRNFWESGKLVNLCAPFSLVSGKNLSPASHSRRLMCTKTNSASSSALSAEDVHIFDSLVCLFNKQAVLLDNPELKNLGPRLNTKVVEAVLNALKSWKKAHAFFVWASNQQGFRHNCYTYNAMASILSHARQKAPLRSMVHDILNSRCSLTPGAMGFLLRCLGSVGLIEEANFMFDQVRMNDLCVPNSYTYNCLLEALSNSDSVDSIDMRLQEMKNLGWECDKFSLTPVLKVYCRIGKFEKSLDIFNYMDERGWVDAHVFSILLVSLCKWGEVDRAFQLIEKMEELNVRLSEKTFYVLIHGFVKEYRLDLALQLFDKMLKLGCTPEASLYDVLIGELCKNKDLEKAMRLYDNMKESGIQPDVGIVTKLISSFPEESDIMLQLLMERPTGIDDRDMVQIRNAALSGLVNNGSIVKACKLLRAMMGQAILKATIDDASFPNLTSFGIVIDGLFKNKMLDTALSLFNDMIQCGFQPSLLLYNNLIDGLCDSDRLEEGLRLLREMKESGLQPTSFTHNCIFGCLCRREDVLRAIEVVKDMRISGHEPWMKHSTLLVKQLCERGRAFEACNFLSIITREGFLVDIMAYSAAMAGLIKMQELDQALQLFQEIQTRGYQPDVIAYNVIINGLCKANRVSEAQELLNEMVVKGLVPSVVTYNVMIDAWCKQGDVDQARLCFYRTFGEDREPSVVTYTTLIDGLCNAGRPDDAVVIWDEMEQKGCAPNRITFMALIHGLCKCGRPDAALVYLREMEERKMVPDSSVRVTLVNSFISVLDLQSAFEILNDMVDKKTIPNHHDKNYIALMDAVSKLSEDSRTSSSVRELIANGSIRRFRPLNMRGEDG